MHRVGIGAVLFGVLLLSAPPVSAQVSITGIIAGTVTDVTKAAIPGATVKLIDEGTKVEKTTVTNSSGVFTFRDLSLGSYEVTITLTGFRTATYNKVVVEAGRTTEIRAELAVGGVEQNVTVEGRSPVLDMTSNVIGSTLSNKEVAGTAARPAATRSRSRGSCRAPWRRRAPAARTTTACRAGHQPDHRRRQQLLERLQERRHQLLRHGAGAARRRRSR